MSFSVCAKDISQRFSWISVKLLDCLWAPFFTRLDKVLIHYDNTELTNLAFQRVWTSSSLVSAHCN